MDPRRLVTVALLCAVTGCGWVADPSPSPDDPVREGSRVTGAGRVESLPGHPVRLCANDLGWSRETPTVPCEHGVDVTGVDLAALADRREEDGVVTGRAMLTGTWRDGVLVVDEQGLPRAPGSEPRPTTKAGSGRAYSFTGDASPCPLPEGTGNGEINTGVVSPALQRFFREHPDAQPFHAIRLPAPDHAIVVLAVQNEEERDDAERILRPALGEQLCVVDARVTAAELQAARADSALQIGPGPLAPFAIGLGMKDDLSITPEYRVEIVMITDELREAADDHPDGLVKLQPMLRVVSQASE